MSSKVDIYPTAFNRKMSTPAEREAAQREIADLKAEIKGYTDDLKAATDNDEKRQL
jgi:hypothetical protein